MKILKFHLGLMLSLSIFLSAVIPSNVQAVTTAKYKMSSAKAASSVQEVFQKFQYAMTVEWDQKDEAFKKQAESDLVKALLALQEAGISLEEIQAHMEKSLLSKEAQAEYKRLVAAMSEQNLSDEQIKAKTIEFMSKAQRTGVNFNGEGGGGHSRWGIIVAVIIVVVITHLVLRGHDRRDNEDHDHDYDHDHDHDYDHDYDYDYLVD